MNESADTAAPPSPALSRFRLWWAGAAVLAGLAVTGIALSGMSSQAAPDQQPGTPSAAAPTTTAAAPTTTAAPTPPPTTDAKPAARASAPIRLTIESAGMDLEILPLTPTAEDEASQSLVPPFTDDAYWLTSFGEPGAGSTDTTYITGHSWEDREAPFNRLSTGAKVGDAVLLTTETGTLDYVIDSVTTHDKDTLKDSDIWDIVPGRLVIVSCYTEDPWGKNVIVTAVPDVG